MNDLPGFQMFTHQGTRGIVRATVPKITLSKSYNLSLNQAVVEKYGIKKGALCQLFWNPDRRAIGINLINNPNAAHACRIRVTEKYGANISAKAFCTQFGIPQPTENTARRPESMEDYGEKLIVVTLGLI